MPLHRAVTAITAALGLVAALVSTLLMTGGTSAAVGTVSVHVAGNALIGTNGVALQLRGADRSGMEYACAQGWGLASGPMDQASVDEMATWGINAVRIPLNEDCWLDINGVKAQYGGAAYQQAVESYVSKLHHDGMIAILDLHWNAPGTTLATGQEDMADADHSPAFWSSVASTFKSDPGIIFDLYNEPHDITWPCWQSGCSTPGYPTAGMQQLVNAVRSTGATQPVMLGGLGWGGSLAGPDEYGTDPSTGWLQWHPTDPAKQEIVSLHLYNFSGCNTASCWNQTVAPVAAKYPVVTGEFGETDCSGAFVTSYMNWADQHGVSYLSWAWNQSTDSCGTSGPSLIQSYTTGTPTTGEGAAIQAHYLAVKGTSPAPPTTVASTSVTPTTARSTTTTTRPTTTTTRPTTTTTVRPTTTTSAVPPTGSVSVTYQTVSTWPGGGQSQLVITNNSGATYGTTAQPWSVTFTLPVGDTVDLWDATATQTSPGHWTAAAPSWEQTLPAGTAWSIGYNITGTFAPAGNVTLHP